MPFDTGFVYELQNTVFQIQKIAIGLPVLVILASLIRLLLWAILTPVFGRMAGLAADLCVFFFVIMLFTRPELMWAAVNWSYSLASRFVGGAGAGGLPGMGAVDQVMREFDNAFSQLTGLFG